MNTETLAEEFARLIHEYRSSEDEYGTKSEAWNLIADFAVDNADVIELALKIHVAGYRVLGPDELDPSLRDWFAGHALTGLSSSPSLRQIWNADDLARQSYQIADAMLVAKSEEKP